MDDFRKVTESWFRHNGVPHFAHRYSGASRVPDLMLLLCTVFAFELGAAPWFDLTATNLLVAQASLIVVTLAALPMLRSLFDLAPRRKPSPWWWILRAPALLIGGSLLFASTPSPYSDAWVNFAVLFTLLAAATVLFSRSLWAHRERDVQRAQAVLVTVLVGALVLFALEGSVFDQFDVMLADRLPSLRPAADAPQGLFALLVAATLLGLALRLARRSRTYSPMVEPRPDRTIAIFIPTIPMLLLVLGGETAVLPHAIADGWPQAELPLAASLAVVAFAWVARRRASHASCSAVECTAGEVETFASRNGFIALVIVLFVFAFPAIVAKYLEIDAFGTVLTGRDALLLTVAFNLASLAVAWLVVAGGLDRIGLWSARAVWANRRSVTGGMVRGLPLLLVFTTFLVVQAELWEVVVEVRSADYWLVVALLIALTAGFILASSARQLLTLSRFDDWQTVRRAALKDPDGTGPDSEPQGPFRAKLEQELGTRPAPTQQDCKLKRLTKVNALGLITVYQTLVFMPLTIVAGLLFYLLGHRLVPPPVAAEWAYGDGTPPSRGKELTALGFFEQPWTRVAIVLAAFSALYLATQILSNSDQRKDFFEATDRAISQRLAVRLAYVALVPRDPVPDRTLLERVRKPFEPIARRLGATPASSGARAREPAAP